MPDIRTAIYTGPLSGPERRIMPVILHKSSHIWSTTLEDLAELAIWEQSLKVPTPENLYAGKDIPLTFDTKLQFEHLGVRFTTYQLKTVRWALQRLGQKGHVEVFKLHGRNYYGSKTAFEEIQARMAMMDPDEVERFGFGTISTQEEFDEGEF